MTKDEIISKVNELYDALISEKYEHWYNRDTMIGYHDSYEHSEAQNLEDDRNNFISELENFK